MVDHTDAGDQRYDAGVGLHHFLYRAYSPSLGRWLHRDPAGFVDGLNLYEYVSGSPLNFVDPHGLFFQSLVDATYYTYKGVEILLGGGDAEARDEVAMCVNDRTQGTVDAVGDSATMGLVSNAGDLIAGHTFDDEERQNAKATADAVLTAAELASSDLTELVEIGGKLTARAVAKHADEVADAAKQIGKQADNVADDVGRRGCNNGLCFAAGTLVDTPTGSVPIESVRVGKRVTGDLGEFDTGGFEAGLAVSRNTSEHPQRLSDEFVAIRLVMRDPAVSTETIDIETLIDLSELLAKRIEIETEVWVHFDELRLMGWARVVSIQSDPVVESGPGRLVRSTITHHSTNVLNVWLEGESEPLRATGTHPLYSLDRSSWVAARELTAGERLRTRDGEVRVTRIESIAGRHRVYNIEVDGTHQYFVSKLRVLVHNAESCPPEQPNKPGPSTNPNAPHNKTIREEGERLKREGYTIEAGGGERREQLINTPGGHKEGRRPDIIASDPAGNRIGVNVGKTRADGTPVTREQKALDDLNGPGGLPTSFVPTRS